MKEIRLEFQIEDKDYLLFIEKQLCYHKFYLFQQVEGRLDKSIKIEKVSTSTVKDVLEHWWILLGLKLRKKDGGWREIWKKRLVYLLKKNLDLKMEGKHFP